MTERNPKEFPLNPEPENQVLNRALLLTGELAAPVIIDRIFDLPDIRRVIVLGEPGANKTTILLQLAAELTRRAPQIEPSFVFFDNALARTKKELGIKGKPTNAQYAIVSQVLTREMEETLPPKKTPDGKRGIQFVELVGISGADRGVSTLRKAASRVKNQNPLESDTLVIAVAADVRSLRDAGAFRKSIADLENPLDIFSILERYNTHLTDYPRDISQEELAIKLKDFFGNMAPAERIREVHNEVMLQATRRSAEDEFRLFRMLKLPDLPFPITSRDVRKNYLLNAAFLQEYLHYLGLKPDMYDTSFKLSDKGLVVFSPYNPDIPKTFDLRKALS